MDLGLAGKTVLVTGGASNIGRGISLAFAKEGSNVVIADLDEPQGQKVAGKIRAEGGNAIQIKTDVTAWDQVQAMVKKALDEFKAIDVLVNNAGWSIDRSFVEKPREEWEKEIAINFWGVINCTRAVLDNMTERKGGSIVSISSDAGRMGEYREVVYSGAKAAVIGFTKSLAREVGRHGIRVNVVCPGVTIPEDFDEELGEMSLWRGEWGTVIGSPEAQEKAAKLYPLRKLGRPRDIANAVVFLASDCAGHITGQTVSVSGGYTMI